MSTACAWCGIIPAMKFDVGRIGLVGAGGSAGLARIARRHRAGRAAVCTGASRDQQGREHSGGLWRIVGMFMRSLCAFVPKNVPAGTGWKALPAVLASVACRHDSEVFVPFIPSLMKSIFVAPRRLGPDSVGSGSCRGPGAGRKQVGITIVRDDWGIAHVHGKTDADAVFGMYGRAGRGRLQSRRDELQPTSGPPGRGRGRRRRWRDLRMKLFIDPDSMKAKYATSPASLKKLMDGWADGLNFYLAKHPDVKPRVIKHFEPWMALTFSEGSIGGDIEKVNLQALQAMYGGAASAATQETQRDLYEQADQEPRGSNGIAISPNNTLNHRALLINPHTSFFFRSELQVTSDAGLNAYGAATWGQFFIYQGFNANAGWMHTSSGVDNVDEFAETIVDGPDGKLSYRYGTSLRPVMTKTVTLSYRKADGSLGTRTFKTYATHHGPIVRNADGKWIAFALMNRPVEALSSLSCAPRRPTTRAFSRSRNYARTRRTTRCSPSRRATIAYFHATSFRDAHEVRLGPSRWTAAIRRRIGTGSFPWTRPRRSSTRRTAGCTTPTTGHGPPRARTARSKRTSRNTSRTAWRTRAGLHAVRALSAAKNLTLATFLTDVAFDPYQTGVPGQHPGADQGVRRHAREQPAQGQGRGTDRDAPEVGPQVVGHVRADHSGGLLVAGTCPGAAPGADSAERRAAAAVGAAAGARGGRGGRGGRAPAHRNNSSSGWPRRPIA